MSRRMPIAPWRFLWIALPGLGGCVVGEADQVANTDQDGDGVQTPDDCDDKDPAVYPGAPEVCDGIDNDCSGGIDDQPTDGVLLYTDADGDGFGVAPLILGCSSADGVALLGDCNDGDPAIHPGALDDNCDGVDDNCDGIADSDRMYVGFVDADGDGYGDPAQPVESCDPSTLVPTGDDCDDANTSVHPAASEACGDGIDSNCDGTFGDECGIENATERVDDELVVSASGLQMVFAGFDLDRDGNEELLLGDEGSGSDRLGSVRVLWDEPEDDELELASAMEITADDNARRHRIGRGLVVLDDFNGDGWPDLAVQSDAAVALITEPWDGTTERIASVDWGTWDESSRSIAAIVSGGDLTGDGRTDLVLAEQSGKLSILAGDPDGLAGSLDSQVALRISNMQVGRSRGKAHALCGGDITGDGIAELVVGDTNEAMGEALVFEGGIVALAADPTESALLSANDSPYDRLGRHVAPAGDMNHDGYLDLAVAVRERESQTAMVVLLPGDATIYENENLVPIDGTVPLATFAGPDGSKLMKLVPSGDLTGDGIDDLTILLDDNDVGRVQVQAGSTTEIGTAPTEHTTSETPVFESGGVAEMAPRGEPLLVLSAPADGVWVYQVPGF